MRFKFLAFALAAVFSANATVISYVNVKMTAVEKHAENLGGTASDCTEGSQSYLILGLKNASGTTSYVWVATSNPQYKDLEALALSALTSGINVTAQADNDGSYQRCGITGGKLRFLSLNN